MKLLKPKFWKIKYHILYFISFKFIFNPRPFLKKKTNKFNLK